MNVTAIIKLIILLFLLMFYANSACYCFKNFVKNKSAHFDLISEDEDVSTAINAIYVINNNVNIDSPLTDAVIWKSYLLELETQSSILIGKEHTFSFSIAKQVAKLILDTLELLMPLNQIWSSLEPSFDKKVAGQCFLAITEITSVMMNIQIERSNGVYQFESKHDNNIVFISQPVTRDTISNFNLKEEIDVTLPMPDFNFSSASLLMGVTVAKLSNLRKYMAPLKNEKLNSSVVYPSIIAIKVGSVKQDIPIAPTSNLLIRIFSEDNFVGDRHCAFWERSSNANGNWSALGCTVSLVPRFLTCACNHLAGMGFGVFEPSIPNNDDDGHTTLVTSTPTTTPLSATTTPMSLATPIPTTIAPTTPPPATTLSLTTPPRTTTLPPPTTLPPTTTPPPPPVVVDPDEIANEIEQILNSTTSGVNTTEHLTESLTNLTSLITDLTANDATIAKVNLSLALNITSISLNSFNQMIEAPDKVWGELNDTDKKSLSSDILKSVSDLSILMNKKQTKEETVFKFSSIEFHSKVFAVDDSSKITFNFSSSTTVELPIRALDKSLYNSKPSKDSLQIATSAALVSNLWQHFNESTTLPNSDVLSITVAGHRQTVHLKHGLKLRFETRHKFKLYFRDRQQCSFWNGSSSSSWSTEGCTVDHHKSNLRQTACECDHLTDFAATVDIRNREVPSPAKSYLTFFCSSITCLFLCASLYLTLRHNHTSYRLYDDQFKVKTNRFWLNVHITLWLLISHLLVMFGMDWTEFETFCLTNSLFLLYSLLTTLSFSLALAVHLYLSTSRRHLFTYFPFWAFALFAYLCPLLLITGSTLIIFLLEVGNDLKELFLSLKGIHFCWISSWRYPNHVWIFVAPMTIIVVVNCSLLVAILLSIKYWQKKYEIQKNLKNHCHQSESQLVNWYVVAILVVNFGFPWLLYVFYINEQMATFFSYVFIVANGMQGVSLFAEQYYVYRQNKLRNNRKISNTISTKLSLSVNEKRID